MIFVFEVILENYHKLLKLTELSYKNSHSQALRDRAIDKLMDLWDFDFFMNEMKSIKAYLENKAKRNPVELTRQIKRLETIRKYLEKKLNDVPEN